MDTSLKEQAKTKVVQAQNITIAVSQDSKLDGLASGLALMLALKKQNKSVTIIARVPTVSDARLLYGVGDIGKSSNSSNLEIDIKNAVENVDKVTYNLEQDTLKIIVHALPASVGVSPADVSFTQVGGNPDLIIAIGYNDTQLLNTDIAHRSQIDSSTFLISISKVRPDKKFAQIEILDTKSPSISETVTGFSQLLALPIDTDIAFNLYTGIASATRMFSPSIARAETLSTAAWLLEVGAGNAGLAQRESARNIEQSQPHDNPPKAPVPVPINDKENNQVIGQPMSEIMTTPLEQVEREKHDQNDWLKPPKIYHGSKSFDIET